MAKKKRKIGAQAKGLSRTKKSVTARKSTRKSLAERDDSLLWKRDVGLQPRQVKILRIGALGLFLLMALLSLRVGLNGDDDVQANYSSALPSFYTSFGKDTSSFSSGPEIKYYGAVFEILTGATNEVLGFDKTEPAYYQVRHVWNSLFGAISILFLVLLVGEIAGFQAALIAAFLSFFTLRFLGHSFFNPKDIPFAAGYMMSVYYIYRLLKNLPKPDRWTYAGLTLGIALCIGVRIGGILVIAYLGMFLGLYFLFKYGISAIFKRPLLVKQYTIALLLPSLLGLGLSLLFWPYGLINPFAHIPAAFEAFDQFQYAIKVLFDGSMVWSRDIPLNYILTWMLITVPVFSLVGVVLFLAFSRGIFNKYNPWAISLVLFTFAFPIIYVVIKNSILYDGWRHFLFTYPPAVVFITLGWKYLIDKFEGKKALKYAVWGLLGLTSIDSIAYLLRNSAFPYTYFNPLRGGIKGAFGMYELDYWGSSIKQGLEWLEEEGIISPDMTDTISIASNFSHALSVYAKRYNGKVKPLYVRWRQRHDQNWDYSIFINRFVDGSYLRGGHWPTDKTIHTIDANGISIAMIEKEDQEKHAFLGTEATRKKQWDQAIFHFQQELEKHPNNELALVGMGMAYLNKNQPQGAKIPLETALKITPENQNALNFSGYYHFLLGNYLDAKVVFQKAAALHSTNATASFYLGRMEMASKNYIQALDYVQDCISANGRFRECYQLGAQIYDQMGDAARAKVYRDALGKL